MNIPDRPPDPALAETLVRRGSLEGGALEGVAVLTLCAPGGNRLSAPLIAALSASLSQALADPAVTALVLAAEGADFCAGASDDQPPPSPDAAPVPSAVPALSALCAQIDAAAKPVVAALHGTVASGGLALALACGARIGAPDTTLALPEGRLFLLPPGNAAIRLAWALGAGGALRLIGGAPLAAPEALATGLLDRLSSTPLAEAAAAARARASAPHPAPHPQPGLADPAAYRAALASARAALPKPLPAHRRAEAAAIDAVEAAQLLPPEQAMAFDLALAEERAQSPEARAAAHLARARRRALATPSAAPSEPVMAALTPATAARLVPPLLHAGHRVILHAPDREALTAALESVAEAQLADVRAGRLTEARAEADWQRVLGRLMPEPDPGPGLADREHADWLIRMAPAARPLVIWSDATRSATELSRSDRALLAVPAPTRPALLCELVAPRGCSADEVASAHGLIRALGLLPLHTTVGSVLIPMIRTAARAAVRLRAAGVSAQTLAASGILPPGLAEGSSAVEPTPLPCAPARLLLLALVNQAAHLLANGTARRPSDIDLAMVLGAGWPDWRGGPLAEADGIGLLVLRHELQQAEALDPDLWSPAPLLTEMVQHGWRFDTLNRG